MRYGPRSVMREPAVLRQPLDGGLVVQTARRAGEPEALWQARHCERVASASRWSDRQFWLDKAARLISEHMERERKAGAR